MKETMKKITMLFVAAAALLGVTSCNTAAIDEVTLGQTTVTASFADSRTALDGAEVAQVYVGYNNKSVIQPVKQLKGYEKVNIAKGATHHFAIEIPYSNLSYYDIISHDFVDASKDVTIYVGSSAQDIHLTK